MRNRIMRKKGPDKVFSHAADCKIVQADPGVKIPWSEVERGHWEAVCVCGRQDHYEPTSVGVRLDPLDPSTSRHAPQCDYADEAEPAVLKLVLKVQDGSGGPYWWTTCHACDHSWQVPHYAESLSPGGR